MKRGALTALALLFILGLVSAPSASAGAAHSAAAKHKRKKCKANWVFKKGKCRHRKGRPLVPQDNSPRDIVRATLTWQGDANLDLIIEDAEDRQAGYSPSAGSVINEIPDATHLGDVGSGGGTEQFVDHLWHPNPFLAANRGFLFGYCGRDIEESVTGTLTFVRAFGGSGSIPVHFDPPPPPGETGATNICASFYG